MHFSVFTLLSVLLLAFASAKNVAYIHGDVAADGTVPSGDASAFDQMLLDDPGWKGLTEFRDMVVAEGYTIRGYYDQETTLNESFLAPFDVVIFGLHQKLWSVPEKVALDDWLRGGGGMLIYSDSASGGSAGITGLSNPVGKNVTDNLIAPYGMQVTVDLGAGTRSYRPDSGSSNPIIWDQPIFEGEGVSPVAVDPTSGAQVLIPIAPENRIGGGTLNIPANATSIASPSYGAMAMQTVGRGHIVVIFDRQPMWNSGPGSDIGKRDNRKILRRTIRFLALDYGNSDEWMRFTGEVNEGEPTPIELSWRQWSGGAGTVGIDYTARNHSILLETSPSLEAANWTREIGPVTLVNREDNQDETETVTVHLEPELGDMDRLFVRLARESVGPPPQALVVEAGRDQMIGLGGRVGLEGSVLGGEGAIALAWGKVAGPGDVSFVSFANGSAANTTATFTEPGTYILDLTATDNNGSERDEIEVRVVAAEDVERAINCVGSAYSGLNGFDYEADAFFAPSDSISDNFPNNPVAGTEDDALYTTARSRFSTYSVPVPNGTYTVYLQFAETFWASANQRVFDLSIEGELVLDDLDLAAIAPGKWVAYNRAFQTTVTDGDLQLSSSASVNNSLLNAFVIIAE